MGRVWIQSFIGYIFAAKIFMQFFLPISISPLQKPIEYADKIYLTGSCFTEHISAFFRKAKFQVLDNSHGILFNPISVCRALQDVIENKKYGDEDLFCLNEYWHSWFHHSDFSFLNKEDCLQKINEHIEAHHLFLKESKYLIVTFGSAFAYFLKEKNIYVSNNHRAPHQWFRKDLLETSFMVNELQVLKSALRNLNGDCEIIFTISPVRHSRDGVVENSRSKARLIEAVHQIEGTYYFPSYELIIDVLRDYRFYDSDLVHPNYAATLYVWQQFVLHCIHPQERETMQQMEELYKALHHNPKDKLSKAHEQFLMSFLEKTIDLKNRFPFLDFEKEERYFRKMK